MKFRHCEERQRRGNPFIYFCIASFMVVMMISISSFAQDEPQEKEDPTYEQRLELSEQMHDIWITRLRVEKALDKVALRLPESERAPFKAAMRRVINFDVLEQESIDAMAEIFTADELKAMVEFYGSSAGRSISTKMDAYEEIMSPVYTQMLDKALVDIKFGEAPGQFGD